MTQNVISVSTWPLSADPPFYSLSLSRHPTITLNLTYTHSHPIKSIAHIISCICICSDRHVLSSSFHTTHSTVFISLSSDVWRHLDRHHDTLTLPCTLRCSHSHHISATSLSMHIRSYFLIRMSLYDTKLYLSIRMTFFNCVWRSFFFFLSFTFSSPVLDFFLSR